MRRVRQVLCIILCLTPLVALCQQFGVQAKINHLPDGTQVRLYQNKSYWQSLIYTATAIQSSIRLPSLPSGEYSLQLGDSTPVPFLHLNQNLRLKADYRQLHKTLRWSNASEQHAYQQYLAGQVSSTTYSGTWLADFLVQLEQLKPAPLAQLQDYLKQHTELFESRFAAILITAWLEQQSTQQTPKKFQSLVYQLLSGIADPLHKEQVYAVSIAYTASKNRGLAEALLRAYANQYAYSAHQEEVGKLLPRQGLTEGQIAPEINMLSPKGAKISLFSLQGQIVLVDFWASWCGPCRAENRRLRPIYETYHSRGFEILSVSLDSERNDWLEAIEEDQTGWQHVSDLGGFNSPATTTYQIEALPTSYLLDPSGKVIGKDIKSDQLIPILDHLVEAQNQEDKL